MAHWKLIKDTKEDGYIFYNIYKNDIFIACETFKTIQSDNNAIEWFENYVANYNIVPSIETLSEIRTEEKIIINY